MPRWGDHARECAGTAFVDFFGVATCIKADLDLAFTDAGDS